MNIKLIRDDIQFLRGLSVIIIFFFHFDINNFKYFYVGVDIFFLISGYVITNSIFNYIDNKKDFDLSVFFLKRVKRIYPNLLSFIIIFNVLFFLFLHVNDGVYFQTIISSLTTFFGISNFYYILNINLDYFSETVKWLNHTWSLSVELQFYVFFGLLISLLISIKRSVEIKKILFFCLIGLSFISFYFFIFGKGKYFSSYYFGPARFWEFFLGSFLYFFKSKKLINLNFNYLIIIYLIYLTVINFIPYQLDHKIVILIFLLPVYFLLIFNQSIKLNFITKIFKFYGNISYSFFLWHLPIISFVGLLDIKIATLYFIISLLITSAISFGTYRLIEIPLNQRSKYDHILKKCFKIFGLFIVFISIIIFSNNNIILKIRDNLYQNLIKLHPRIVDVNKNNLNLNLNDNWVLQFDNCSNNNENFSWSTGVNCLNEGSDNTLFYILGNSYGDHFVPIVYNLNKKSTIYKARFENCYIDNTSCNNKTKKIIKKFYKISKNYDQVFLIISLKTIKISKEKIENILNSIPKQTNTIFVLPHPTVYIFSDNEKFKKFKKDRNEYYEIIKKLKVEYNLLLFDPYEHLCKNDNCNIDKFKEFLTDGAHFKLSTSKSLSINFINFLR